MICFSFSSTCSSSPLEDVVPPHRTGMRGKGRRYKASQIPLQPVEMPSGIDALTLDVSHVISCDISNVLFL